MYTRIWYMLCAVSIVRSKNTTVTVLAIPAAWSSCPSVPDTDMWWFFVPLFENSELGLVDGDCCGRLGSNGSGKLCAGIAAPWTN